MGSARLVRLAVATAALLTACSSSPGEGAAPADTTSGPAVEVAALHLEGKVDQVVAMVRPSAPMKPPDATMVGGGTLLGVRHLLRAPKGDGGMIDLWVMRIRNPQMGQGVQECRVTESDDGGSSGSCSAPGPVAPPGGDQPLVLGMMSDGFSATIELVGPADMTHFIVTAGDKRIAVIPIEGEALLYLDGACPAGTTVAAWRGEELIREEPGQFC